VFLYVAGSGFFRRLIYSSIFYALTGLRVKTGNNSHGIKNTLPVVGSKFNRGEEDVN
jgi:hypothetical protein